MPSAAGELLGATCQPISELLPRHRTGPPTSLEVVLKGCRPATSAMDTLNEVRDLLKPYAGAGDAVVSGGTAVM